MEKGKLKILEDWYVVRNSILRAESGEMKVTYLRPNDPNEQGVVGLAVDMELRFGKPLPAEFTEKEKKVMKEVMEEIGKKISE